jgi:hypothetical protein
VLATRMAEGAVKLTGVTTPAPIQPYEPSGSLTLYQELSLLRPITVTVLFCVKMPTDSY